MAPGTSMIAAHVAFRHLLLQYAVNEYTEEHNVLSGRIKQP